VNHPKLSHSWLTLIAKICLSSSFKSFLGKSRLKTFFWISAIESQLSEWIQRRNSQIFFSFKTSISASTFHLPLSDCIIVSFFAFTMRIQDPSFVSSLISQNISTIDGISIKGRLRVALSGVLRTDEWSYKRFCGGPLGVANSFHVIILLILLVAYEQCVLHGRNVTDYSMLINTNTWRKCLDERNGDNGRRSGRKLVVKWQRGIWKIGKKLWEQAFQLPYWRVFTFIVTPFCLLFPYLF